MYFNLFLKKWLGVGLVVMVVGFIYIVWGRVGDKNELLDIGGKSEETEMVTVGFPDFNADDLVKKNEVRILAVGDVMFGRMVGVVMAREKNYQLPFLEIKERFVGADIVVINLESPIYDPCPLVETGMRFCVDRQVMDGLVMLGVSVAGVANNHIRNYGKEGYEMTIDELEKAGIQPSDEVNMAVVEKEGLSYGFWGVDLVSAVYKDEWLVEKVTKMSSEVDVFVVLVHWGPEYKSESDRQKKWGRLMVDSGADLVIGHHPHVVQGVEIYKGVPIVYSLGNFVFDQMWSTETREGVIGEFVFMDGKLEEVGFEPVFINEKYQPTMVIDQVRRDKILSRLGEYSL